eukprot:4779060-Alexandrium_andersonii.AAC.1
MLWSAFALSPARQRAMATIRPETSIARQAWAGRAGAKCDVQRALPFENAHRPTEAWRCPG